MSELSKKQRRQLVSAIAEDPHRRPIEKETSLYWSRDADTIEVHTAESALMRRFVRHPLFTLDWVEISTGERATNAIGVDELPSDLGRRSVYSINGTLPITVLTVSGQARNSTHHAKVVSPSALVDLDNGGADNGE